jgi:diaminopimelate decarboxylase
VSARARPGSARVTGKGAALPPGGGGGAAMPAAGGAALPADGGEPSATLASRGTRDGCRGVVALPARLEPWQLELCARPELVREWLDLHGSPINLIDPTPMARNAAGLADAAAQAGLELGIYFARKANKALALVDRARELGLCIDLASECELAQVLGRGVPGSALVMTAAVKPRALLACCVASGTTVVIDNTDELAQLAAVANAAGATAEVALRLAPVLADDRPQTRFGFTLDEAIAVARHDAWPAAITITGVHFHLDGYDPDERVSALREALTLIDALRERGHEPTFVDIGGGFPVSYVDSASQWERFWTEHRAGLLGERTPLTFDGHGLGLLAHDGEIIGSPAVYPFHQRLTGGAWLAKILASELRPGESVAGALRARDVQLRCEPGRALLDGCGLTAARVAFRKRRRDGTWLIGVELNRTQCRSTSDDFLVDPLLLRPGAPTGDQAGAQAIEGYLVGAYCIERELLTWRRLVFDHGVDVGDIVVFPNTAGYLMHILESSSHQIPLARNLVVAADLTARLDPIDAGSLSSG